MIAAATAVKSRCLALLDDPNGAVYTDAIILEGLGEAVDAECGACLLHQIPRFKVVTTYALTPGTTSLTPATAGITNMGELIHMEERLYGSSEKYTPVWQADDLPQRAASDRLLNFEWRGDAWYFVGATTIRELRISYFSTTTQPTDFTGYGLMDGDKTFLAKYTAAVIAPRKGEYELADRYMLEAVGPKYDKGIIGGELLRLLTPMIRSRQQVPLAVRPFSATRRMGMRRFIPYVAAQAGFTSSSGVTGAPDVQLSSALGTITGTIDGVNDTFYMSVACTTISLSLSGNHMTPAVDYSHSANVIRFVPGQIPTGADVISLDGWL